MKKIMLWVSAAALICGVSPFTSCCSPDDDSTNMKIFVAGIPDDSEASANPVISSPTTYIPNIQTSIERIDGVPVMRVDMTGVQKSGSSGSGSSEARWMRLYGTGFGDQNVWVEVDGKPKGISVTNTEDEAGTATVMTDVVFAVDNSGSMSEEADALARDIISWAEELSNSGLDAKFAVVGYDGRITGGIDFTTASGLSLYLEENGSGTSRTMHFGNNRNDWSALQSKYFVNSSMDECGVAAIRLADENYSFRIGANRVYVDFTDEPNYPTNKEEYSVKYFEDQNKWPAYKGTIHTVYSGTRYDYTDWNAVESPWLISDYTGGSTQFVRSDFSDTDLSSLIVSGAMQHSYIIKFANIEDLLDGNTHKVHVTIKSEDGSTTADKTFDVIFK